MENNNPNPKDERTPKEELSVRLIKMSHLKFLLYRRIRIMMKKESIFCQCSHCGSYFIGIFNGPIGRTLTSDELFGLLEAQGWEVIPDLSIHCKECTDESNKVVP